MNNLLVVTFGIVGAVLGYAISYVRRGSTNPAKLSPPGQQTVQGKQVSRTIKVLESPIGLTLIGAFMGAFFSVGLEQGIMRWNEAAIEPAVAIQATAEAKKSRATEPSSGELTPNGFVAVKGTDVSLRNFIAEATFINPYPLNDGEWSYGFVFRRTKTMDSEPGFKTYDFFVRSDGRWIVRSIQNTDGSPVTRDNGGTLPNLNTRAGATNTIRIIVTEQQGIVMVNEKVIETVDLSTIMDAGNIGIGAGFEDRYLPGASFEYRNFTVWSLP